MASRVLMINNEIHACLRELNTIKLGAELVRNRPPLAEVLKFPQSDEVLASWVPDKLKEGNTSATAAVLKTKVIDWKIINDWYNGLDSDLELTANKIEIQSVDFFGINVGFVKFVSSFTNQDAVRHGSAKAVLPSIVFMRSAAVAILPVISVENDLLKYTIVTVQARVPAGKSHFVEIPAGMMDASSDFKGIVATEMKQETGITLKESDCFCLTDWAYSGAGHLGMYPSSGGCNEYIKLFLWEKTMTGEQFAELLSNTNNKLFGEKHEGEFIRLKVIPLDTLAKEAPDGKALSALALYDRFSKARHMKKQLSISNFMLTTLRDVAFYASGSRNAFTQNLTELLRSLFDKPEWQQIKESFLDPDTSVDGLSEIEKSNALKAIKTADQSK